MHTEPTRLISPSVQGVIRQFAPSYIAKNGKGLPLSHRKALRLLSQCRTVALGGHVVECGNCKVQDYTYHSCGHRSCPRCMSEDCDAWLGARRSELLPVPYFHVVYTVPEGLNGVVRSHQRELYPVLMQAAGNSLLSVAAAPENLGGRVGVMSTLHTSSSALAYHLHVHCLVPAGSVDAEGEWHDAKDSRLGSESALGKAFRDKVGSMMKAAVPDVALPDGVFDLAWKVHLEVPQHGAETVLRYLGRSVHRGPMSDHRIVSVTETHVVFKYRDKDRTKAKTMCVDGHEFLRRFLQHVWPDRVHKVRYAGLWSRKCRAELRALRQRLLAAMQVEPPPAVGEPKPVLPPEPILPPWRRCPHCQAERFIVARFKAGTTPPPLVDPLQGTLPGIDPP